MGGTKPAAPPASRRLSSAAKPGGGNGQGGRCQPDLPGGRARPRAADLGDAEQRQRGTAPGEPAARGEWHGCSGSSMPSPPSWSGRLSPALAGELHRIIDRDKDTELTADELRVEYATLLAWTIGLVIGILSQIDAASTKIGPGPAPAATGDHRVTIADICGARGSRHSGGGCDVQLCGCGEAAERACPGAGCTVPVPAGAAGPGRLRGLAAEAAS